ncbi:hypothetical protein BG004_000204 [Podila humilis]|nr:hypothetical protein BG004_000204 [Podila humilis]
MKHTFFASIILVLLTSAGSVSAQSGSADCTVCLQTSIQALPLCTGLDITMGNFNPSESTAYAACLCSSLDGKWIEACSGDDKCGGDILSFQAAYAGNIQSAGLVCTPVPTFIPRAGFPTK